MHKTDIFLLFPRRPPAFPRKHTKSTLLMIMLRWEPGIVT